MTDQPDARKPDITLPEKVRYSVLRQAAEVLGGLTAEEVPPPLRAAARFAPAKRVQLSGAALAATIETDAAFRAKVAQAAEAGAGPLSDALREGTVPPAADPVQVGALAFLLRPAGWAEMLDAVRDQLSAAVDQSRSAEADRQRQRLQAQVDEARQDRRTQGLVLAETRAELDATRRQVRDLTARLRAAEEAVEAARAELAQLRQQSSRGESTAQGEARRLRQRLVAAEDAVEAARRSGREARNSDDARLWLLVETLAGATQGLRRELALSTPEQRPGDAMAQAQRAVQEQGAVALPARGDDPVLLDRLLTLPMVHVVIDGYNVTKSGYGDLPLQTQRSRLVTGLGALAAQTGAEVTCVFDGAGRPPLMPASPRGVRVLFSESGHTADDLIRRFVAAEPRGRPVVVVSSDREVADGVRSSGAYPVASAALLRRLDRG